MADLKVALGELKEESDSGALEAAGAPGATVRGKIWWAGVLTGIVVVACLWEKSRGGRRPGLALRYRGDEP